MSESNDPVKGEDVTSETQSGANDRVIEQIEGEVKWFDSRKGYGFIVGPQGQDVFVHYTKIEGDGFRALKDGSKVVYSAELTDKGWHATRVIRGEALDVQMPRRRQYSRTSRR